MQDVRKYSKNGVKRLKIFEKFGKKCKENRRQRNKGLKRQRSKGAKGQRSKGAEAQPDAGFWMGDSLCGGRRFNQRN